MYLHRLTHVAPPTVNKLPPHQNKRISFVCVRAQSPPGLELVPCAFTGVDKQPWPKQILDHDDTHTQTGKLKPRHPTVEHDSL